MRSDPQDYSQEYSEDQNVEGGLCRTLEESKGGNFLVTIWPTLWALHGRYGIQVHLYFSSWAGPGLLGAGPLRNASKTVWMLSDNKVATNPLNVSRLELLHKDNIWHTHAR